MSNMLRKGKRQLKKQRQKEMKHASQFLTTVIDQMNYVYSQLHDQEDLSKENIRERIKEVTNFKFADKQLEILERELLKEPTDESEEGNNV